MFAEPISSSAPTSCESGPPSSPVTPSMPATCSHATWMPTPVRNPISTVRERKSARKPRRASRASSSIAAATIASIPASAVYSDDPDTARPVSPAAMIAAVAESAPTTRCREEPRRANARTGRRIV